MSRDSFASGVVAQATRQINFLALLGVPYLRCVRTAHHDAPSGAVKDTLAKVIADVQRGSTLSKAFAKHSRYFDAAYVNAVERGQSTDELESAFTELVESTRLAHEAAMADFVASFRHVGLRWSQGARLDDSMLEAERSCKTQAYKALWQEVRLGIRRGHPMDYLIGEAKMFPEMVISAIAVGEKTGDLPGILVRLADFYDIKA